MDEDSCYSRLLFQKAHNIAMDNNLVVFYGTRRTTERHRKLGKCVKERNRYLRAHQVLFHCLIAVRLNDFDSAHRLIRPVASKQHFFKSKKPFEGRKKALLGECRRQPTTDRNIPTRSRLQRKRLLIH